jgi:hypothetical protein
MVQLVALPNLDVIFLRMAAAVAVAVIAPKPIKDGEAAAVELRERVKMERQLIKAMVVIQEIFIWALRLARVQPERRITSVVVARVRV